MVLTIVIVSITIFAIILGVLYEMDGQLEDEYRAKYRDEGVKNVKNLRYETK